MHRHLLASLTLLVSLVGPAVAFAETVWRSHPPQRPLPTATTRPMAAGPQRFVDASRGDDSADGSQAKPWKTLRHAVRQLQPGDTLYLRGGTYYETVSLVRSGTETAPITIAGYPGEQAVLDGGRREFFESPATSWRPATRADQGGAHAAEGAAMGAAEGAAEGEYVSTGVYLDADDRQAPRQFLPGSHEPMWGIEDERPLALGHFGDSMVPLHGYRIAADLRATNECWLGGKHEMRESGVYGGPGLWFNRQTGRIHVRLARHRLTGLGARAYRGETDPRRIPLVVAVGFGRDVLRLSGVRHVRIQDLTLRGATGSPMIHVYGAEDVAFDGLHVYGGFPGLLVNASRGLRVVDSAFRGLAAPWTSRAHMKYRGTASYQIVFQNNQPRNEDVELANCEFTDDHDFAFLRYVKNLRFHHNLVDNFNDDGLEIGPKLRDHTLFVSQNRIGACLIPLTQHELEKDESPLDHDAATGVFVYRNVIDLRAGVYRSPPKEPDAAGDFLHEEGHLAGDHGGPTWPVLRFYHNTVLRHTPVFRDSYLFGLGLNGLRRTERDVFNNIFVQTDRMPGVGFVAMKQAENLREGGNLIWGVRQATTPASDPFQKFRESRLFQESRQIYAAGWTTHDRAADPRFVRLDDRQADLRLQNDSPAIGFGRPLPAAWPDPLRKDGAGPNGAGPNGAGPDSGVLPAGAEPWRVGIQGRVDLMTGVILEPAKSR